MSSIARSAAFCCVFLAGCTVPTVFLPAISIMEGGRIGDPSRSRYYVQHKWMKVTREDSAAIERDAIAIAAWLNALSAPELSPGEVKQLTACILEAKNAGAPLKPMLATRGLADLLNRGNVALENLVESEMPILESMRILSSPDNSEHQIKPEEYFAAVVGNGDPAPTALDPTEVLAFEVLGQKARAAMSELRGQVIIDFPTGEGLSIRFRTKYDPEMIAPLVRAASPPDPIAGKDNTRVTLAINTVVLRSPDSRRAEIYWVHSVTVPTRIYNGQAGVEPRKLDDLKIVQTRCTYAGWNSTIYDGTPEGDVTVVFGLFDDDGLSTDEKERIGKLVGSLGASTGLLAGTAIGPEAADYAKAILFLWGLTELFIETVDPDDKLAVLTPVLRRDTAYLPNDLGSLGTTSGEADVYLRLTVNGLRFYSPEDPGAGPK